MSGYQIPNNIPNFFIANGEQQVMLTSINFLQNGFAKPTERQITTGPATVAYMTVTADQLLDGFVVATGPNVAVGTATVQFPLGSVIFDAVQARVYGQQGITVNPPVSNRAEFFGLTAGFTFTCKVYNNTSALLAFQVTAADSTLTINQTDVATTTIPIGQVGVLNFTVLAPGEKRMTVNVLN
jgi:hypothetical protein